MFFFHSFLFFSNWQLVNCKEKSRQKNTKKSLYEKCKKIDRLKMNMLFEYSSTSK